MRSASDVPWANVHGRRRDLLLVDDRLLAVEETYRAHDNRSQAAVAPDSSALRDLWESAAEFRLLGEAAFMFADAGLNTLAEAIAEQEGMERFKSISFESLMKQIQKRPKVSAFRRLRPFMKRFQAARVQVILPRSILAVHPPARTGPASGISYLPTGRMNLESSRLWPDAEQIRRDAERLQRAVAHDMPIPNELAGHGRLIAAWAVREAADLGPEAVKELDRYVRVHGCSASPGDAISLTAAILEDVAASYGYPIEGMTDEAFEADIPQNQHRQG